jgi:hypothetical protein
LADRLADVLAGYGPPLSMVAHARPVTDRSAGLGVARTNRQPMRRLLSVWPAAGVLAGAGAVAGCGGGSQTQPFASPPLLRQNAARMAPGLANRDLLYLTDDGDGNVFVYSFPDAKLQGTLTGCVEYLR